MIYIIPTDHEAQSNKDYTFAKQLSTFLKKKINELDIKVIGEEWNDDASTQPGITESITEEIANELGIKYIPCEPRTDQWASLGIRDSDELTKAANLPIKNENDYTREEKNLFLVEQIKDFSIRERYWLKELKKYISQPTIFICNVGHISSFNKQLWEAQGLDPIPEEGFNMLLDEKRIPYQVLPKQTDIIERQINNYKLLRILGK